MAQETNRPDMAPAAASTRHDANRPDLSIDTTLSTFFEILAASLATERARSQRNREPGRSAGEGRDHPDSANRAATVKQAHNIANARRSLGIAGKQRQIRASILAAATVILVAIGVTAAWPKRNDPLPPSLMGVWQSTSDQYADRAFELKPDQITFQQGEADKYTTHAITTVRTTPDEGESALYVVEYDIAGDTYQFAFVYQPDEGAIRFKNQPMIKWYK